MFDGGCLNGQGTNPVKNSLKSPVKNSVKNPVKNSVKNSVKNLVKNLGGFVALQKCNSAAEGLTKKSTTKSTGEIHLGNQGRISLTNPTNEMAYNSIPGVGLQPKPGARARSLP